VVEYGALLGLIAVSAILGVRMLGDHVAGIFSDTSNSVSLTELGVVDEPLPPLDPGAFALMVNTSTAVIYPMAGGSIVVDWGDETANATCGQNFIASGAISCGYPTVGEYRISISGDMTDYGDDAGEFTNSAITRVLQWGDTGLTSLSSAFYGATNLVDVPADLPPSVFILTKAFRDANSLNDPDIALWDVSNVTTFYFTFYGATKFNVDIGSWDTSSATSMNSMFFGAEKFSQDISAWDVSSVSIFQAMFRGATTFSQDLSLWDVSSGNNMQGMFRESSFNGDISTWQTSSVANMRYMFMDNGTFDQDISNWDVSSVVNFESTFHNATAFSHDLSPWDVSGASYMDSMFNSASGNSSDLSGWCVSGVVSEPSNFSTGSGLTADPAWGTCP